MGTTAHTQQRMPACVPQQVSWEWASEGVYVQSSSAESMLPVALPLLSTGNLLWPLIYWPIRTADESCGAVDTLRETGCNPPLRATAKASPICKTGGRGVCLPRHLPISLRESHLELRTTCQVELLRYRGQPSRVGQPAVKLHFRPYPWLRNCTQDSGHRTSALSYCTPDDLRNAHKIGVLNSEVNQLHC